MRSLTSIQTGLSRCAGLVAQAGVAAPAVSRWSVGEHLDHLIKVHAGILSYVAESPVGERSQLGISLLGRIVLFTGHIPRGRGQSPAQFLPVVMDLAQLRTGLTSVTAGFSRLQAGSPALRDTTIRFAHPIFGGLTRRQWVRFAEIHQQHHLAIIDDILRAATTST